MLHQMGRVDSSRSSHFILQGMTTSQQRGFPRADDRFFMRAADPTLGAAAARGVIHILGHLENAIAQQS